MLSSLRRIDQNTFLAEPKQEKETAWSRGQDCFRGSSYQMFADPTPRVTAICPIIDCWVEYPIGQGHRCVHRQTFEREQPALPVIGQYILHDDSSNETTEKPKPITR